MESRPRIMSHRSQHRKSAHSPSKYGISFSETESRSDDETLDSNETVSSEEATSYSSSSHSETVVSSYTSEEEASFDSNEPESSFSESYVPSTPPKLRNHGKEKVRYIYVPVEKKRSHSRSHGHGGSKSNKPTRSQIRESDKIEKMMVRGSHSTKKESGSSHRHHKSLNNNKQRKHSEGSKQRRSSHSSSDKKDRKKSSSSSSSKNKEENKKKPVASTPARKRKSPKKEDVVINENDPAHVKLAKSIPEDVALKLKLGNKSLVEVTKKIQDKDAGLFAKIVVASSVNRNANFVVGVPSNSDYTYDHLYTCLSNEKAVIDLEHCIEAVNAKADFCRLPASFEKRQAMLQFFDENAPREKRDEYSKSSCKDKTVARMNWVLNHQRAELNKTLSTPLPVDPCSEICIRLSGKEEDEPIKIACIWQADVIRRYHLICVKPKTAVTPLLRDIEAVILARNSIVTLINNFIETGDSPTKRKGSPSSSSKNRPEKKKKSEEVVIEDSVDNNNQKEEEEEEEEKEVMQVEEKKNAVQEEESVSSSSTSSSEEESSEDAHAGRRIETFSQMAEKHDATKKEEFPLFETIKLAASTASVTTATTTTTTKTKTTTPTPTPQPDNSTMSESEKLRLKEKAALIADYRKSREAKTA